MSVPARKANEPENKACKNLFAANEKVSVQFTMIKGMYKRDIKKKVAMAPLRPNTTAPNMSGI
jgi:hypothetical protein